MGRGGAVPGWVPTACYLAAYLFGGYFTGKEALENLRARRFAIDTLMLVAASPCALAISVPSAVLSGIARAAHGGVLVKGGGTLENLGTVRSIAFDKTGTLTEGKAKLTDAVAADGATVDELLQVALAVEAHSDHPLAAAVVSGARERLGDRAAPLTVSDVRSLTGRGVQAQVDGDAVVIGKPVLFSELPNAAMPTAVDDANKALVAAGRTTVVVRKGQRFLAVIGVMDTPRPEAAQVMAALRTLGIERLIMISGDNQQVADDLAQLPFAVGLSRSTSRIMRQNLWVSLGVVALLIPATLLELNIGTAVLFHEGSTLLVVVNALRLLAYKQAAPPGLPTTAQHLGGLA